MKLFYFFPFDPLPSNSGAAQRCGQLLSAFRELGVATHLAFMTQREDAQARSECVELARAFGVEATHYRPTSIDYRSSTLVARGLVALGRAPTLSVPPYASPFFGAWLALQVRAAAPDALLMSYSFSDPLLLPGVARGLPKLMDAIDIYSSHATQLELVTRHLSAPVIDVSALPESLLREELYEDSARADPREFEIYDRYQQTLAISAAEGELIRRVTKHTEVTHLPLTYDVVDLENTYDGPALFIMRDNPFNLHAYAYFVRAVLPRVLEACPDFVLRVIGTGCKRVTATRGVQLDGYVDDLRQVYRTARFFVNPMLGGTGQQVKLVEAMAHGLPAIAFKRAAAESPIVHQWSGLVASDRQDFADHVIRLWSNPTARRELARNARESVTLTFGRDKLMRATEALVRHIDAH